MPMPTSARDVKFFEFLNDHILHAALLDTEKDKVHAAQFVDVRDIDISNVIDNAAVHFVVDVLEISRLGIRFSMLKRSLL